MVSVRVGDVNVSVIFKTEVVQRLAKNGIESVTMVQCGFIGKHSQVLALGSAFCSPLDDVDIELGMELAFERALRKFAPDAKLIRTKFWGMFNTALTRQKANDLLFPPALAEWYDRPLLDVERQVSYDRVIDAEVVPPKLTAEQRERLEYLRVRLPEVEAWHAGSVVRGATSKCSYCAKYRNELAALEALAA